MLTFPCSFNVRCDVCFAAAAEEEEEMQTGAGQLAIRAADMTFEQAIRHYMDEIACTARDTNSQLQTLDNRQGCYHVAGVNVCRFGCCFVRHCCNLRDNMSTLLSLLQMPNHNHCSKVIVSTIIVTLSGSSCARYMQGKSRLRRPVCSEYPYKCYKYGCCMVCL